MRRFALAAVAAVISLSAVVPSMADPGNGKGGGQKPGSGTMPAPSQKGLCQAYFSGSPNGQEHKRNAPPFKDLAAKAEAADQTVEEFCGRA